MIQCFVTHGIDGKVSNQINEILFLNGHEMINKNKKRLKFKIGKCKGVITSDLETIPWIGMEVIVFDAIIETDKIQGGEIRFGIKPSDIDPEIINSDMKWHHFKIENKLVKKVRNKR